MTKIYLQPKDLVNMTGVVHEFDITGAFQLVVDSSSGIGTSITMLFEREMNGRTITIQVPIVGEEDW